MPIDFLPPLPPADGWSSHKRDVKCCRGTACYAAVAAHFGTESPKLLERRVDQREPYLTSGEESVSNKYRRWRQGLALPGDDTVAHIAQRSSGSVKLGTWRDLPLWALLAPEPPPMHWMHRLLESSSRQIQRILFGPEEGRPRRCHVLLDREQTLAIRNQYSLDALIVLLCLARKAEVLEDDPHHFLPSACAYDIFARVLYTHKPLRYRWEGLFHCLERIFWKRVYITGMHYTFPMEAITTNLQLLDADPRAKFPRMSGNRYRVLDRSDSLKQIQDHRARAVSVT